jgi:hypothetical protein
MKISKRENKALQKCLISIFEDILGDAESEFCQSISDEIQPYLEDNDDFLEIVDAYSADAIKAVYAKSAKAIK